MACLNRSLTSVALTLKIVKTTSRKYYGGIFVAIQNLLQAHRMMNEVVGAMVFKASRE